MDEEGNRSRAFLILTPDLDTHPGAASQNARIAADAMPAQSQHKTPLSTCFRLKRNSRDLVKDPAARSFASSIGEESRTAAQMKQSEWRHQGSVLSAKNLCTA